MYLTPLFHVSALCLFLTAHAFPIKPVEPHPRLAHQKRASYSVVAVDGSSPPPLADATTPKFESVTHTVDDRKAATALTSTFTSSIKTLISTKIITEIATPTLVIPTSTVTSISTLRITTVELKTSVSVVTEHVSRVAQPPASYDVVNAAETTKALPDKSLSRQLPLPSFANQSSTTSRTISIPVPTPTSSSTFSQSGGSTSTYTSQPITTSTRFGASSWNSSYPYPNATSSAAYQPCKTGASTAISTATVL